METLKEEFFEPYCQWKREKELDTISIELAGFRMEDVKVRVKSSPDKEKDYISMTAESPRCLRKKIEIPPNHDYDLGKVSAVFCGGSLNIKLPKKAASNKLEISKQKFEAGKFLQESAQDMQKKFSSAVEFFSSKLNVAAVSFMLLAIGIYAYKYYTECYGVEN